MVGWPPVLDKTDESVPGEDRVTEVKTGLREMKRGLPIIATQAWQISDTHVHLQATTQPGPALLIFSPDRQI